MNRLTESYEGDDSAPADVMEISMRRADDSEAREREITEKEEGKSTCNVAAARLADAERVMGT